jgi:hypothetical protein
VPLRKPQCNEEIDGHVTRRANQKPQKKSKMNRKDLANLRAILRRFKLRTGVAPLRMR